MQKYSFVSKQDLFMYDFFLFSSFIIPDSWADYGSFYKDIKAEFVVESLIYVTKRLN